jgi:hypothetical protein
MMTDHLESAPHPQEQPPAEPAERALVLEVLVEQPGQTCNLYQHDRERRALRLERVIMVETPLPADLAALPLGDQRSALDRIGERAPQTAAGGAGPIPRFPVFLLSSVAVAPGTWVTARLIGAVRDATRHAAESSSFTQGWWLLAVPQADTAQAAFHTISQLPPERRVSLAAAVLHQERSTLDGGAALNQQTSGEALEWVEADESARVVRQAQVAWRHAQRQSGTREGGPREHLRLGKRQQEGVEHRAAWKALEGVSAQQLRERGIGAFAEAEHLLRLVPQRFQQYLEELLLEDERVLCFIERPRLRVRRGVLGLGAQYLSEGLLLCTDRQVLWLRDVAAPDATLIPWGYRARSCPVERLTGVQVVLPGEANAALGLAASSWVRLVIQSAAAGGISSLVIEFPESTLPALQEAVTLLARFLPFPSGSLQALADRRVRRLPNVSVWQPRAEERDLLLQLGGMTPVEVRERLERALREALSPGEVVLAQAVAPALAEYRGGPRLLAVTPERLFFGQTEEGRPRKGLGTEPHTTLTSVPLAQVAAVQLRHSLLGCGFEVVIPTTSNQKAPSFVPFNSPGIVPFRAIFTRTRLLLSHPYQGVPTRRTVQQTTRGQGRSA